MAKQQLNGNQLNPAWQDWTPTIAGYSSISVQRCRYMVIGKTVFMAVEVNGTSNANLVTMTYPPGLLPKVTTETQGGIAITGDTSNYLGAVNHMSAGSQIMRIYRGIAGGASSSPYTAWATTGTKAFTFNIFYEIA